MEQNVFIRDEQGDPAVGTVWPGKTYFPDFHAKNTDEWWFEHVSDLWDEYKFDGLWVDMNEPASFEDMDCPDNDINFPRWTPPLSTKSLGSKTVCPSFLHNNGILHRDIHNLYGLDHARTSNLAMSRIMPEQRPFILSRSGSVRVL